MMMKLPTAKHLLFKILMFCVVWFLAFHIVEWFEPGIIDMSRLFANVFGGSIVFMIGYVLTVIGFDTKR